VTETYRFIVETAGKCQYSVRGVEAERGAGPARRDGVGQRRRGRSVPDDGDGRFDAADDDAEGRVLGYVEHVERL